ncbi:FkbM family methyltransferase [Maribacter sp. 2-571]|uniref:FkbM family methyltransferase n=1 Tax=Maribacter sp. 2-571 TaxID=3417569 RepID=UPI003D358569
MKKQLRKSTEFLVNTIAALFPKKTQKARFLSMVSSVLIHKNNTISYDPEHDMYWLKSNGSHLYMVKEPYFYFSKTKLYNGIKRIACKHYLPQKGDVIVDVGAGIGTETLFFNEHVQKEGKIYSIEASKASHEKLQELCVKNNIQNSENLHMAITDHNQEVWIEESDRYQVDAVNKNAKGTKVDGITLDHLVKVKNIDKIDFLKANIEGSELPMIDGMRNAIKITKHIAVSCHDFLFEDNRQIKEKMSQFLVANGFEVFYNNTGHQVVDSWIYGKRT